jgi:hypothetical protein
MGTKDTVNWMKLMSRPTSLFPIEKNNIKHDHLTRKNAQH